LFAQRSGAWAVSFLWLDAVSVVARHLAGMRAGNTCARRLTEQPRRGERRAGLSVAGHGVTATSLMVPTHPSTVIGDLKVAVAARCEVRASPEPVRTARRHHPDRALPVRSLWLHRYRQELPSQPAGAPQ